MTLVWIIVGIVAGVYLWRLSWFVLGALLVPLVTAAAWLAGVASGWWDRRRGREEGFTPGGEGQGEPARPRAEVIDLAAARQARNRPGS